MSAPAIPDPDTLTDLTPIPGWLWRAFYQDGFPDGWYIDDVGVDFEDDQGRYILPDDAVHRLSDFGVMGYQGETRGAPCDYPLHPVRIFFAAWLRLCRDTGTFPTRD